MLTLLWYLLLLILGWIALWVFFYVYSAAVLCPYCGGEMESRFEFRRGQGRYCKSCLRES